MPENLPYVATATGGLTSRQYTVVMLHPDAAPILDHVELATPMEAVAYLVVVFLWLAGVGLVVYRKLHASR